MSLIGMNQSGWAPAYIFLMSAGAIPVTPRPRSSTSVSFLIVAGDDADLEDEALRRERLALTVEDRAALRVQRHHPD